MERRVPGMSIGYRILQEGQRIRYYESGRSRFLTEVKEKIEVFTPDEHAALAGDLFRLALSREGVKQQAALSILKLQLGERNDQGFYDLGKINRNTLVENVLAGLNAYIDSTHRKPKRQAAANEAVEYVTPFIPRNTETQTLVEEACNRAGLIYPTANQTVIEREVFDTLEAVLALSQKRTELSINDIESELLIYPAMIPFYVRRLIGENLLAPDSITQESNSMEPYTDDSRPRIVFSRVTRLEQFLQILILCNYDVPRAANEYGISRRDGFSLFRDLKLNGSLTILDRQHPTGLQHATKQRIEAFLDFLVRHNFIVEDAATEFGISVTTGRYYLKKLIEAGYTTAQEAPSYKVVLDNSERRAKEFLTFLQEHNFSVRRAARAYGISFSRAYEYIDLLKLKKLFPK